MEMTISKKGDRKRREERIEKDKEGKKGEKEGRNRGK